MSSKEFIQSDTWFYGPRFLQSPQLDPMPGSCQEQPPRETYTLSPGTNPPIADKASDEEILRKEERKPKVIVHLITASTGHDVTSIVEKISKLRKKDGFISCNGMRFREKFPRALASDNKLHRKSTILALTPRLHENLVRVGGRIEKSNISYDRKHPILLPRNHLTNLIVHCTHEQLNHGGTQLNLAFIQRRYWIIRGRKLVQKIIRACKICTIHRAATSYQLMADLPSSRVVMTRPFTNVGVDFAGPVVLKCSMGWSPKTTKACIAVYVCFCTKAVNLELVSDLSTTAFIASLRRFTVRRGLPKTFHSDNGSNFVGATRELQEILAFTLADEFQTEVTKELTNMGISWKWRLSSTLDRYAKLSTDQNDLEALTPGHFRIGEPLTAVPEPNLTELKVNRLDRWQHQQYIKQHFWNRWYMEYLQQLQKRTKWKEVQDNMKLTGLVVIREENIPLQKWKLGRVTTVHINPDDEKQLVRQVSVRTTDGIYKRPITKLVLLPRIEDQE
ncbi:unnamed protein product [Allacma fusca]|uniref:Integrase catalytic domain-containing protein n=1 Tax=Allacma fusca TaxID=39272 RepID=A0A8J2L4D1_9HEXA|nr:unnamed protein product [Allacma fusca]